MPIIIIAIFRPRTVELSGFHRERSVPFRIIAPQYLTICCSNSAHSPLICKTFEIVQRSNIISVCSAVRLVSPPRSRDSRFRALLSRILHGSFPPPENVLGPHSRTTSRSCNHAMRKTISRLCPQRPRATRAKTFQSNFSPLRRPHPLIVLSSFFFFCLYARPVETNITRLSAVKLLRVLSNSRINSLPRARVTIRSLRWIRL